MTGLALRDSEPDEHFDFFDPTATLVVDNRATSKKSI